MPILDEIDYRIISLLQEDGRRSNVDIAQRLNVSEVTVRRRINKLIKQDFMQMTAVTNPIKLGFPVVVLIGVKVERGFLNEAANSLAKLKEVRFLGKTSGRYDLVFEVWLGSNEQLLNFLSEQLGAFKGIGDAEVIHILEMVKYTYDWGTGNIAELAGEKLAM